MWELIKSNQRKSFALFLMMGVLLVIAGYFFGEAYSPGGGMFSLGIAVAIWIVLSAVGYFSGSSILLSVSGAKEITPDIHPRLYNVVEEMKIASNFSHLPKIYIIDEDAPNAFAAGKDPKDSAIAVTAGLLARLNRDELQGVVAHEMSHIVNRDSLYMTFAGITLGSIVLISNFFLRGMRFTSGGARYRSSSRSSSAGGQAQLIIAVIAIIFAILSPIIARLLYFALSRKREYLADASAVRLTRYPEGLASALEKLADSDLSLPSANRITAPMYIVNPLKKEGMQISDLTSTHPPIHKRIEILRNISGGANYVDYQKAYRNIHGPKSTIIPPSGLSDKSSVPIRNPVAEKAPDKKSAYREANDIIRAVDNFAFYPCSCGLHIIIPPDLKQTAIECPRCKRPVAIPAAELVSIDRLSSGMDKQSKGQVEIDPALSSMTYRRRSGGRETFSCSCGAPVQLSPDFEETHVACPKCGKSIKIYR